MSRPVRALWIEILYVIFSICQYLSRPVRALWIEIQFRDFTFKNHPGRGP